MPIQINTYQDINTCIVPLYIFKRLVRENMNFALIDLENCIIELNLINPNLPISSENLLHVFTVQDDYTLRYTNINSPISIEKEQNGKRKHIITDDYKICSYSDFLNETMIVNYTDNGIYTQIGDMLIYEKYIFIKLFKYLNEFIETIIISFLKDYFVEIEEMIIYQKKVNICSIFIFLNIFQELLQIIKNFDNDINNNLKYLPENNPELLAKIDKLFESVPKTQKTLKRNKTSQTSQTNQPINKNTHANLNSSVNIPLETLKNGDNNMIKLYSPFNQIPHAANTQHRTSAKTSKISNVIELKLIDPHFLTNTQTYDYNIIIFKLYDALFPESSISADNSDNSDNDKNIYDFLTNPKYIHYFIDKLSKCMRPKEKEKLPNLYCIPFIMQIIYKYIYNGKPLEEIKKIYKKITYGCNYINIAKIVQSIDKTETSIATGKAEAAATGNLAPGEATGNLAPGNLAPGEAAAARDTAIQKLNSDKVKLIEKLNKDIEKSIHHDYIFFITKLLSLFLDINNIATKMNIDFKNCVNYIIILFYVYYLKLLKESPTSLFPLSIKRHLNKINLISKPYSVFEPLGNISRIFKIFIDAYPLIITQSILIVKFNNIDLSFANCGENTIFNIIIYLLYDITQKKIIVDNINKLNMTYPNNKIRDFFRTDLSDKDVHAQLASMKNIENKFESLLINVTTCRYNQTRADVKYNFEPDFINIVNGIKHLLGIINDGINNNDTIIGSNRGFKEILKTFGKTINEDATTDETKIADIIILDNLLELSTNKSHAEITTRNSLKYDDQLVFYKYYSNITNKRSDTFVLYGTFVLYDILIDKEHFVYTDNTIISKNIFIIVKKFSEFEDLIKVNKLIIYK